ncbi:choice-of-anchor D domain-containing protein [Brevifollis gellanilyticus]|uniref:Choice-of-anchor D domain-containing protein n=1 Tax=Brevifollis gellanilyticus TaxID=748831 RepID=A0A512MB06_9BACT|nr:choice-of-anchor D domain-containing protein [Brevifollis gellanilyticus]GEP43910.1 hypothetical protein BGE01nite_32010 [Brevifollis gellanilyticus]
MRLRPTAFALTLILNLMMGLAAWAQTAPEIVVETAAGENLTSGAATVDLGAALLGDYTPEVPLIVKNAGTADLTLGVEINNARFFASGYVGTLTPGQSTTVKLKFRTTNQYGPGTFTTTLKLRSNDADESPFDIVLTGRGLAPDMEVEEPVGSPLNWGDDRDFGQVSVGSAQSRTFTITNVGTASLAGLAITSTNSPPSPDFTITEPPAASLGPGASTTFTIRFAPTVGGLRGDSFKIASNDWDDGDLLFYVRGTGMEPEISVIKETGFVLQDGGSHAFLWMPVGMSRSHTFTVKNDGLEPLTGLSLTLDGEHAGDYLITQPLSVTELAPGAQTNFTVQITPSTTDFRRAALHITSNDATENPFDITLSGAGSIPEIQVENSSGVVVPHLGTSNLGSCRVGTTLDRTFRIKNVGFGSMMVFDAQVSDGEMTYPDEEDFQIYIAPDNAWVTPGLDFNLRVIFQPKTYGTRTTTLKIMSEDPDESPYEITLTGTGLLPGFQIEQPADTAVTSPYTRQFGLAAVNTTNTTLTFTIKNPGTQALTLGRTITGTNATDFTIVAPFPLSSVPAGSSTTLTVQFSPKTSGARQAMLNLTHNAAESGSGSFQVHLSGTGVYSQVELTSSSYNVNHGETEVSVTMTRDDTRVPASVELQTLSGPRSSIPPVEAALAGEDFTSLTGPSAVVNFAIGEAEKTVTIPLLAPASGATESRQFRVKPINPGPGVILRPPYEALVRIVGADSAKPTLTLTTPAAGKISTTWPLVVSGKTGDAKGIDRVEVKLGSADPVLATLSPSATKPTDVPFTCDLYPADGTYTLVVTAYDLRGNSTSVTRSITFTRRHTLTVKLVDGSADPVGLPGTLAMTATPAASAAALKTDVTNALIKTTTVVPGTQVKLVATPKAGYVFGRWLVLNSNGNIVHTGPELTLTMPDTGLTVEAMLVPSPFTPLPGHNNSLHWMLVPAESTEAPLTASQFGYLSGTITLKGGFTGKLLMNGQTLPVTATFYGDGPAFFTVAGQKRDSLPVPGGNLKLYYDYLPATLTSPTGELLAMAEIQHGLAKAPASLLNSATKGTYTVRLNPAPEPLDPATFPQASGYATMTLSNTGVISLAGALADGTAVTQTSALLPGNKAPVFIQLPTPGGTTKLGLLIGQLDFDIVPATTDVTSALQWFRPAAASAKVQLYPAGWPGGIGLDAQGALYSATKTAQSAFFGLTSNTPSPARLHFTGGKLTSAIEKTNFSLKGNTVVKTAPADASYTLAITPATGLFSGTFTPNWSNPGSAKPAFKGVILQKGTLGTAAGFFISNAKGEPAPESGAVILSAPVP